MQGSASVGGRMLADRYGRGVTDLRISVTDTCNFKCVFCHNEGLGEVRRPRDPRPDELSPEEIERIVRVAHGVGINSIKLTGGEPTVRLDLEEIVARIARHVPDVSMTTNGSMLAPRAQALKDAGLRRVNVSLHALDAQAFRRITQGSLRPVLKGIQAALEVGLTPVKLNMVVYRDTVEIIPAMVEYVGNTEGLMLQLIQFMPDLKVGMEDLVVDMEPIRQWLHANADLVGIREMHHRRIYHLGKAKVEVVDPVWNTEFCMNCHRIRLTHDGKLKGCLNRSDDLVSVRGLDDEGIRAALVQVVANRVPYYGVYVKRPGVAAPEASPGIPVAG